MQINWITCSSGASSFVSSSTNFSFACVVNYKHSFFRIFYYKTNKWHADKFKFLAQTQNTNSNTRQFIAFFFWFWAITISVFLIQKWKEIFTLSTCASNPSWLLWRFVSRTSSFACDAKCSNSDPCELWRCELAEPSDGCVLTELPEPVLDVRSRTFVTLPWRAKLGLSGGTCEWIELVNFNGKSHISLVACLPLVFAGSHLLRRLWSWPLNLCPIHFQNCRRAGAFLPVLCSSLLSTVKIRIPSRDWSLANSNQIRQMTTMNRAILVLSRPICEVPYLWEIATNLAVCRPISCRCSMTMLEHNAVDTCDCRRRRARSVTSPTKPFPRRNRWATNTTSSCSRRLPNLNHFRQLADFPIAVNCAVLRLMSFHHSKRRIELASMCEQTILICHQFDLDQERPFERAKMPHWSASMTIRPRIQQLVCVQNDSKNSTFAVAISENYWFEKRQLDADTVSVFACAQ